jgi:hypothetical protein
MPGKKISFSGGYLTAQMKVSSRQKFFAEDADIRGAGYAA